MKYRLLLFWLFLFVVLFVFLQITGEYHFYYVEQNQLFQFSGSYLITKFFYPGGLALLLAEFFVQFFALPYVGAAITAFLLTAVGICTMFILKRIAPTSELYLLYILPVLFLLCLHFDFNYFVQGTIAYILFLKVLYGYVYIQSFKKRLIFALVMLPLLFWWGGAVAILFAVCVLLWEAINRTNRGYLIFLVGVEAVLLGVSSVYFAILGEYRFAFLPDAYYNPELSPNIFIYYSWICFPLLLLIASLFRNRKSLPLRRLVVENTAQLLIIILLCWLVVPRYIDRNSDKIKEFDYFTRTEQWNKIIDECEGKSLDNFLYLCYLNMALAEKGQLADRLFEFDQRGPQGLIPQWNKTAIISTILSDIYFTVGDVPLSQEMAFESFVSSSEEGNPRMLKRLIQTNLIYGAYPIAEKYIDLLEKTFYYRKWATDHRRFLYNDEAVENDPLLGAKRKDLLPVNYLARISIDLQQMAEHNPSNTLPVQYLGSMYLLSKEMNAFKMLVEKYYGTEVLPVLPISFQEGIIILAEHDQEYWTRFRLSKAVVSRFAEYKRQMIANRKSGAAAGVLAQTFGDTYWYYFTFK